MDMEEYLRKTGGDTDEIPYYQFCRMLDVGTGGNASRISSYISQSKGSHFVRFSYFVNHMDKLPKFNNDDAFVGAAADLL